MANFVRVHSIPSSSLKHIMVLADYDKRQSLFRVKYTEDFGICVYMCLVGSMNPLICKIFYPLRPQVLEATFPEHVGGLSQGFFLPQWRGCLSIEGTLFTFQPDICLHILEGKSSISNIDSTKKMAQKCSLFSINSSCPTA